MGEIITVASQKGGVGKTTTVLNLAYSLSRLGDRILVIDADPQGGMALASNLKKRTDLGLIQILRSKATAESVTIPTRDGTMAMVGTGVRDTIDALLLEEAAQNGALVQLLKQISAGFDYTIIDAPAGVGSLVLGVLEASSRVILAIRSQNLALKSLPSFLRLLQYTRKTSNPDLRLEGVLVTLLDERNPSEAELLDELSESLPDGTLLHTIIPFDPIYEEASQQAMPVAMMANGREAARPYLELAIEIKEREIERRRGGETDDAAQGLF